MYFQALHSEWFIFKIIIYLSCTPLTIWFESSDKVPESEFQNFMLDFFTGSRTIGISAAAPILRWSKFTSTISRGWILGCQSISSINFLRSNTSRLPVGLIQITSSGFWGMRAQYVTLKNIWLDQAFISNLPKMISRLTRLTVNENSELITDFNFIFKLEKLSMFATDRYLGSLESAIKAFRHLNELTAFSFREGDEKVRICHLSYVRNNYFLDFHMLLDKKSSETIFSQKNLK